MLPNGRSLVTGASGCIGRALVQTLLDRGREVSVIVRDVNGLEEALGEHFNHARLHVTEGDLNNPKELRNAAKKIDSVFHAAAKVHTRPRTKSEEEEFFQVNVEGTKNLMRAVTSQHLRSFVFFSTIAVYGSQQCGTLNEAVPLRPDSAYALSKHEAEKVVTAESSSQGIRSIILRLPLVYGPGDRGNMLQMIKAIDKRRFILIDQGKARKSLIYSQDVVDAALRASFLDVAAGQTFLVADPRPYEMRRLAQTISEELGKTLLPFSIPARLVSKGLTCAGLAAKAFGLSPKYDPSIVATLTSDRICDVSRMKSVLGYMPAVDLQTGIKRTIDWYRHSLKHQSLNFQPARSI